MATAAAKRPKTATTTPKATNTDGSARMPPPVARAAPRTPAAPSTAAAAASTPTPRAAPRPAPASAPVDSGDGVNGRLGHYGWPAIALAVLGLVALILHLTVPYSILFCGDADACPDDKTTSRKDLSDAADLFDDAWVASAGPGITLAGAIILLSGGLLLAVLGFVPMAVGAARWLGWLGGLVAFLGAWFVASSSLYWLGDWVTSLMNLGNDGGPDFVLALSPLLVGAAGITAVLFSLCTMRDVVTTRDGHRESAGRTLAVAKIALLFLALTLIVPWSFQNPSGDGYLWHSALGIQTQHGFTDGGNGFGGAEQWSGMSYGLSILLATAWVAAFAAVLASAQGLLATGPLPAPWLGLLHGGSLFMLVWSAVLYVLMWVYMWKPSDGADDYLPGFFPALVLAGLVPLAIRAVDRFREALRDVRSGTALRVAPAVRFD